VSYVRVCPSVSPQSSMALLQSCSVTSYLGEAARRVYRQPRCASLLDRLFLASLPVAIAQTGLLFSTFMFVCQQTRLVLQCGGGCEFVYYAESAEPRLHDSVAAVKDADMKLVFVV